MGGFQAVAAGLGQAGEEAGKGINDALTQALKVRAQTHLEEMDQAHLNLANKANNFQQAYQVNAQHQAYSLAQQQHELAREMLIKGGNKDLGSQLDPVSGKYFRAFYNDVTGKSSKIPLDGVPPDSPAGQISYMKTLQGMTDGDSGKPLFTPMQAKQIAFKMPSLYREGPAGIVQSFIDDASEQAGNGVKSISVPGVGKFDITTPGGRANYAQATLATIHPGGLYRALNPTTLSGKAGDQTGWTANEMREYKSTADQAGRMETALTKLMEVQLNNTLDPQAQQQISSRFMDQIQGVWKNADAKQAEINARHQTNPDNIQVINPQGVPGTIPRKNLAKALSNGYTVPPSQVASPGANGGQ